MTTSTWFLARNRSQLLELAFHYISIRYSALARLNGLFQALTYAGTLPLPNEASGSCLLAKINMCIFGMLNCSSVVRMEPSSVPVWLDLTMHLINAVVAWVDVCTSERTFRKSSLHFALFFAFSYILWMQICAAKNKVYPYPFEQIS